MFEISSKLAHTLINIAGVADPADALQGSDLTGLDASVACVDALELARDLVVPHVGVRLHCAWGSVSRVAGPGGAASMLGSVSRVAGPGGAASMLGSVWLDPGLASLVLLISCPATAGPERFTLQTVATLNEGRAAEFSGRLTAVTSGGVLALT